MNVKSSGISTALSHRAAGVLLHVTSLPGRYGIGDLGPAAHQWVDLLASANQRWWQMLPLAPCGEGNSPYRSYSAFAGEPLLISLESLVEDQLLDRKDLELAELPGNGVHYPKVIRSKMKLLRIAHDRFQHHPNHRLRPGFEKFCANEATWLDDFALFMALRLAHPGQSWTQWPRAILRRKADAMREASAQLAPPIAFYKFVQFIFFTQLQSLRDHARDQGVLLIGDLPIFVSPESADVWTNPGLFQLDRNLRPIAVSGVPPDLFSAIGQRWGNPLYNWKAMASDQFAWWKARLSSALRQADLVRIDHFRGFEAYWRVPCDAPTAQTGKWVKAPGGALFAALLAKDACLPLLAEDLGIITPEVEALRDRFNLPGMRVLQFGFGAEPGNPHTPHNFVQHCFAYTGTHDNDTSAGWYRSLPSKAKRRLREYAPQFDWTQDPVWSLIQLLHASTARHAIVPMQDLLTLGSSARMNTPGGCRGNWEWRLPSLADCESPLHRLAEITRRYERSGIPVASDL